MSKQLIDQYNALERSLDRELSKHPAILQLERRTGVRKTMLVLLTLLGIVGVLALRLAEGPFLVLLAFLYPAMGTAAAIEGSDKKEDTRWLAYWMVIMSWTTAERLGLSILAGIIPFYGLLKAAACIWLMIPQTKGSVLVYERAVRPVVLAVRDNPQIKELLGALQKQASEASKAASKVTNEAKTAVKNTAAKAEQKMDEAKNKSTAAELKKDE